MRTLVTLMVSLGMGTAPFQCASDPDPSRRMEDSAPEALHRLAARFHEQGDENARRVTLAELCERYPSSRYHERACAESAPAAPATP